MKMESGSKLFNRYAFNRTASKRNMQKILDLLKKKPMSYYQLAEEIHITYKSVANYLTWMNQQGMVYISKWVFQKQGNRNFQVQYYSLGNKPNVPKPPALTRAEIDKRSRQKRQANKELMDVINAKRRLKRVEFKPQTELQIWMQKQENSSSGQTQRE